MSITNLKFVSGGRPIIVLLAGSVVSLSLLIFASGDLRGEKFRTAEMRAVKEHRIAVPDFEQKRTRLVETEVVTVTRRGFEPTTITRPQGEFILMIENPNKQELSLSLSREGGASLHTVRASRQEPDWNEIQNLPPGRYVLTEQSHPEWTCLITITAQ